jgi:dipeptidyl aminopeptidase/acylaminoacyl peptidase
VLDWSSDDSRLLLLRFASINESYLHVLDVADGKLTELAPSSEKVSIGEALFTRDGKGVYFTSDASSEFMQLRRLDLASGQVKDLAADLQWNVSDLALAHDGNQLAFVTNEDGYNCLHILDTATGQQRPVPDMPRGVIGGLRFSPDDSRLAMTIDTPCQPADVYVLELARSELVRWTCTETAGLASDGFVEPELIRYETFDNADGSPRTIPAYYYKPAGDGPFPVLILIHGGPEGQSRPNFSPSIQYWVRELGLAVLVPNVRGSAGYGKSYLLLDNGRRREDSVRDIGSLLDWIDGRDELDQARVGVTGNSYGGYMTLACLCHYNDRLRAGVEAVGVANFVTFLENTQAYRRDWRRQEYGDERDPEMRQFLLDISPTTNVHKITRPLLIAQGLNDPRVPASESEQMVRVIREAGGMVAYVAAEDEGHGFRRKTNRDYWAQATALFLERYLV